jgi:ammonia channel protein AmtB
LFLRVVLAFSEPGKKAKWQSKISDNRRSNYEAGLTSVITGWFLFISKRKARTKVTTTAIIITTTTTATATTTTTTTTTNTTTNNRKQK